MVSSPVPIPYPDTAPYELKRLRLSDTSALVNLGLLPRPIRRAREEVRLWLTGLGAWGVWQQDELQGAIYLIRDQVNPMSARFHLHISRNVLKSLEALLEPLVIRAFSSYNIHRLELVSTDEIYLNRKLLINLGFHIDGILRHLVPFGQGYRNATLWSLLREDYPGWGYRFVPFSTGVVSIFSNTEAVHEIGFLQPGEYLEPGWLFDAAWDMGFADDNGVVTGMEQVPERLASAPGAEHPMNDVQREATRQIAEYLHGDRETFDFPVAKAQGTDFQHEVWDSIARIPYGETRSYMEVALEVVKGRQPDLAEDRRYQQARALTRAVGSACAANPQAIIVPCHRVVGQDLKLTGFAGGVKSKAWLLDMEMLGTGMEAVDETNG